VFKQLKVPFNKTRTLLLINTNISFINPFLKIDAYQIMTLFVSKVISFIIIIKKSCLDNKDKSQIKRKQFEEESVSVRVGVNEGYKIFQFHLLFLIYSIISKF